jgi:1-acyl-sn-glycerol-3-phosphate acyltransferase
MLHRGNLGPARLAVAAGVPIVPVGLVGTEAVQPPDQRLPRIGMPVGVHLGPPRWPDPEPASHRAHLRALTDQVMSDIAELSAQHYEQHAPALITA